MKQIIIIGGGIAGLTAAVQLRGCHVTLLEARERFGGRVHTLKTETGLVELGAEFVHGRNKALLEAIRDAHFTLSSVSKRNRVFDSGKFESVDIWEKFSALAERIEPAEPDQSFLSFLGQQQLDGRMHQMMLAFAEGFNAAHASRLSSHSLRRAEYSSEQMDGEEQSRVEQGYGALVESFVEKARADGVNLLNKVVVRSIRWQPGHVEVEATRGGKMETFPGDAAIITLPLGVLKARSVRFDPPLVDKEEAIAGLEFGNVVKINLTFREPWWPERDFGFIHALDEALPTWWNDPRGATLIGWVGGPKADALIVHSPAQLETLAVESLARVFSTSAEKVRAGLVSSHTHNWAGDPYSRGAYSYIPVNGLFLPKQLGAPVENTLFFAGEATARDAQMGTVFAALESGLRVARESEC